MNQVIHMVTSTGFNIFRTIFTVFLDKKSKRFRDYLESGYFAKIENFLQKVL